MGGYVPEDTTYLADSSRLLKSMAEELKLPLLQIAAQAELYKTEHPQDAFETVETAAAKALWFIDSYLLCNMFDRQMSMELEPVTVSSVLTDAANDLTGLAKQYGCAIELQTGGRYSPVMAHRQGLRTALVGIGNALIAAPSSSQSKEPKLLLAAHKSSNGIVAGVFSGAEGLSQTVYRQGRVLHGDARQTMPGVSAQSGAGVFIADRLLSSMSSRLRVARHNKLTGLAATFQPSQQLSLV